VNHALPGHVISNEQVEITLPNSPKPGHGYIERIDEEHANPRRTWRQMGSPEYLNTLDVEQLLADSELVKEPQSWSWSDGDVSLHFDLPQHSVAAITLDFEPPERKTK
jgi:xylan 1,4-beta-xylosidase